MRNSGKSGWEMFYHFFFFFWKTLSVFSWDLWDVCSFMKMNFIAYYVRLTVSVRLHAEHLLFMIKMRLGRLRKKKPFSKSFHCKFFHENIFLTLQAYLLIPRTCFLDSRSRFSNVISCDELRSFWNEIPSFILHLFLVDEVFE